MPPLIENGFIDEEIESWINKIHQNNSDLFRLCKDVNRLGQNAIFKIEAHNKDLQEILSATLYIKALSTYQGIILLVERGMLPQAQILLRALLETIFSLRAITINKSLAIDYVCSDQIQRLKSLNKLKVLHCGIPPYADVDEIMELEQELKKDIEKYKIKKRSTEDWAKEAGMHDWYLTAYTVLCDSVHTNVRELEEYLELSADEEIIEFRWGPSERNLKKVLMSSIECMLLTFKSIGNLFNIEEPLIDKFHKQLNDLSAKEKEQKPRLIEEQ